MQLNSDIWMNKILNSTSLNMTIWQLILTATTIIPKTDALKSPQDEFTQEKMSRLAAFEDTRFEDPLPDDFILEEDSFEGVMLEDMLLTQEQYDNFFNTSKDHSRKLVNILGKPHMRWPDGRDGWPEIPYTISNLPKSLENIVRDAINHWHKYTCVKFKSATNKRKPYVGIRSYGGCASRVGRTMMAAQLLGLSSGCSLGNTIHELGHTLGFFHEHQRYDRGEYIYVNNHNVKDNCGGRLRGCDPNFEEKTNNDMYSFDVKYDMGSIMHYGPKMFTKSRGDFTLTAKDGELTGVLGQRSRLSHRDIHLINLAYKCPDKWLALCGKTFDPCMNEGYIGSNCKCVCPPGTSGWFCTHKSGKYYDNVKPPCNRHITSPTSISVSHNDVHRLPEDVAPPSAWCVFTIEAPPCQKPLITIKRFKIPDMYWQTKVKCKYAWVEFREHYQTNGKMYCGRELKIGQKIVGASHKMSIFFNIGSGLRGYFEADVTFKRDEQCDVIADEALMASPFGEPITTGNCIFETQPDGYLWKSHSKMKTSDMCTVFFNKEPEPFGLRLEFADITTSKHLECHQYIRYCYHEKQCSVLDLNNSYSLLPSSSVVFEYVPIKPGCSFELNIQPEQSYCHKMMMVDYKKTEEIIIIDKPYSACQLWCKTMENRQVRVQIHIYRHIHCDSKNEWIEVSGGIDDYDRKNPCIQSNTKITNDTTSGGYWYSYDSDDNHSIITLQYNARPETPIIVNCQLKDWGQEPIHI